MNLSDIITKCYILALIIRDDGERLLLGDGFFEFKDNLQHFQPNTYVNDTVELQGTDGQLLAGQVRRTAVQTFNGYIADNTISQSNTEEYRRQFLGFFRKKHFYKVVYIMPDGTAVQRDRGYIVNAPSVPELYQRFPEYSVGLSFEDPNYYEYEEDDAGNEIFAHIQALELWHDLEAGLIWDALGAVSDDISWVQFETAQTIDGYVQISNGLDRSAPLTLTQLQGNATQTTVSGKNKISMTPYYVGGSIYNQDAGHQFPNTQTYTYITITSQTDTAIAFTQTQATVGILLSSVALATGDYYLSGEITSSTQIRATIYTLDSTHTVVRKIGNIQINDTSTTVAKDITLASGEQYIAITIRGNNANDTVSASNFQVEAGSQKTDFVQFVGGTDSPNPSYPQTVNVVSGGQEVYLTGKNLLGMVDGTYANNGITATVSNGEITLTGTATNTSFVNIPLSRVIDLQYAWSISLNNTAYGNSSTSFRLYKTNGTSYVQTNSSTANAKKENNNDFGQYNILQIRTSSGVVAGGATAQPQVEFGASATTYEPYHGQSYEINLGKNLCESLSAGYYDISSKTLTDTTSTRFKAFKIVVNQGFYTLSCNTKINIVRAFTDYDNSGNVVFDGTQTNVNSFIMNVAQPTTLYLSFRRNDNADWLATDLIQLEAGSQATSYAPYKTPIELAKIGTYQDYIWNDDGTWKIHEAVGKFTLDGTQTSSSYIARTNTFRAIFQSGITGLGSASADNRLSKSERFIDDTGIWGNDREGFYVDIANVVVSANISTVGNTIGSMKTWFQSNPTKFYTPLATPTDTEITDSGLIAQLNFIASLYGGVNNIMLIPSAGAQGEMEVRYGTGYLADGSGYYWDEGAGLEPNVVQNNGIDSVRPIWKVPGPATNPTLTNITTAQNITWQGSIPADQTLIVDMAAQTATIAGTNVFQFLEGDWIELAVGPNRIDFTTTADGDNGSTLEWNGVAG